MQGILALTNSGPLTKMRESIRARWISCGICEEQWHGCVIMTSEAEALLNECSDEGGYTYGLAWCVYSASVQLEEDDKYDVVAQAVLVC